MAKILNDKYYTPQELAEYIVNKTKEIIGEQNISEYIEPSAGAGVFLNYLPKETLAYDIEPEDDRIIKQDYLINDLKYKSGRCVIGNPPYGNKNNLTKAFCNKSFELSDYVAFILPISQLNNTQSIYKFDLIHSEDLGIRQYSDRKVHCCFNIYKRPYNGLNKKQNYKIMEIMEIREIRESIKNSNPKRQKVITKDIFDYDIRILAWGTGQNGLKLGGFLSDNDRQYAKEFFIKINKKEYKEIIISLLKDVIWEEIYPMTATPNLLQWHVYKYIKEQIPEIQ